jgi:hypothetical protein
MRTTQRLSQKMAAFVSSAVRTSNINVSSFLPYTELWQKHVATWDIRVGTFHVHSGQLGDQLSAAAVYLREMLENKNTSRTWPESASLVWDIMPFNWASSCHVTHLQSLRHQWGTDPVSVNELFAAVTLSVAVSVFVSVLCRVQRFSSFKILESWINA